MKSESKKGWEKHILNFDNLLTQLYAYIQIKFYSDYVRKEIGIKRVEYLNKDTYSISSKSRHTSKSRESRRRF